MAGGKALGSRAESARNLKTFEKENKQINQSNEIYLSDSISPTTFGSLLQSGFNVNVSLTKIQTIR